MVVSVDFSALIPSDDCAQFSAKILHFSADFSFLLVFLVLEVQTRDSWCWNVQRFLLCFELMLFMVRKLRCLGCIGFCLSSAFKVVSKPPIILIILPLFSRGALSFDLLEVLIVDSFARFRHCFRRLHGLFFFVAQA